MMIEKNIKNLINPVTVIIVLIAMACATNDDLREFADGVMRFLGKGVVFLLLMVILWVAILIALLLVEDLKKELREKKNDNKK